MHLGWLILLGGALGQHPSQTIFRYHLPNATQLHLEMFELGIEQSYWVTADSILITQRRGGIQGPHYKHFARAITPQEQGWLLQPFTPQVVGAWQPAYENDTAPTDGPTFEVTVYQGKPLKKVRLYAYILPPLFVFTERLNKLVLAAFRLNHPQQYGYW